MLIRTLALSLSLIITLAAQALALDQINPTGADHLAIRGTDTTGYFIKGSPVSGQQSHSVKWKGATWRFASAEEAALFRANPSAYAPQFGAYCTGGLSQRHVVEGKPQNWRIYEGKLYLFFTDAGARRFSKDPVNTILKAQAYWDTLDIEQ